MGSLSVKVIKNRKDLNKFTKSLLNNIQLLEQMIDDDMFDTEQMHIGAEQEFCLIDEHFKPALKGMDVLERLDHPDFTTELSLFNVEANLDPQPFYGNCFSALEAQLNEYIERLDKVCQDLNIHYLLTGILPTIRKNDLTLDNITPLDRYHALAEAIKSMRDSAFELHMRGIDELNMSFDSVMLEACNTSFQVHLQVRPDEFVQKYNWAQMIAAPTLAIAANSPLLFGKRLWHESRIALFQQSIDTRLTNEHLRDTSPRVMFGSGWLKHSVTEIFKEDISRFRVLLMNTDLDDCDKKLSQGITPKLRSLNIHNSTVYRWNRPCYGISPNGKPHLRIENRILPSGPTTIDELANTAFWLGLMNYEGDISARTHEMIDFDEVKGNFHNAAINGMNAKIRWVDGKRHTVSDLMLNELLPLARKGLEKNEVSSQDIDRFLHVIEQRVQKNQNGTHWMLRSFSNIAKEGSKEEILLSIASSLLSNLRTGKPVHEWPLADSSELATINPTTILVEEFMTTDLFTVREDDVLELVADMMDWQRIRFIPVENHAGELIGLISYRMILRHFRQKKKTKRLVKDMMIRDIITIAPENNVTEAMELMKKHNIGCLPVIKNNKLVGIVTEGDFLNLTSTILKIFHKAGE